MRVRIDYDQVKAVQAAACLIKLSGKSSMDKLKLVKLLYLVDREAFHEKGRPIVGGLYVSMPHGPVISEVLDSMNFGEEVGWGVWDQYLESGEQHTIGLKADPGETALSRRELRIIQRVFEKFGRMEPFALRNITHDLPEWDDPSGSSIEIPVERLIVATGRSLEEAKRIAQELDGIQFLAAFPN